MVKRKLFLVFFSTLLFAALHSKASTGSIMFEPNAGGGVSALYGSFASMYPGSLFNSPHAYRVKPTGIWGMNLWYSFPKLFSVGTGIYYSLTPHQEVQWISDANNYMLGALERSSINIPLLLSISFGKKIVFFIEGGSYISINTDPAAGFGLRDYLAWGGPSGVFGGVTAGAGVQVPLPHRFALSFKARSNVELINLNSGYGLKSYSCMLLGGLTYTLPVGVKKSQAVR